MRDFKQEVGRGGDGGTKKKKNHKHGEHKR